MSAKSDAKTEERPALLLGRPGNSVSMGIVGMPNVGKSTLFNCLSNLNVPAENYPFCVDGDTPVALATGISVPIKYLGSCQPVFTHSRSVDGDGGLIPATPQGWIDQGEKECVEITLLDGRNLVCTPDHRILVYRAPKEGDSEPASEWVKAGELKTCAAMDGNDGHAVICGLNLPVFDVHGDRERERTWNDVKGTRQSYPTSPMPVIRVSAVGKRHVFDLSIKETESFVCNGIVVHNCTIDPSEARVPVPDSRFDYLCSVVQPKNNVSAVLSIFDIAGLVKGANEGKGLGNAFLSHIQAVDAIYHVVRAFKDAEIEHVEGSVDPIRDLSIISEELQLKDLARINGLLEKLNKNIHDKSKKQEKETLSKAKELLDDKKDIRFFKWKPDDVDILNELQLLTAKPVVYLVNIGLDEYITQKNKWLAKIAAWVKERDPFAKVIPFSAAFEGQVTALKDPAARKAFLEEKKVPSQIGKIITVGYHTLDLIHYFTAGEVEVRAWTIRRGTLAPGAAGVIHSDFCKHFISADCMSFEDFKEHGGEAGCKAAGKYRQQGKLYEVKDGDILFFKHNAGGAAKKK